MAKNPGQAEDRQDEADGIPKPNMCKTCKDIIEKVKKHVFCNSTPVVKKYLHGLIDELMTDDGPNTICTKIHACKPEPPIKEFIVVRDQAHDNF
ncbi:Prosaposin [Labeo rohita]|uniref:Prosaposin n=1 Tax=Labeo rohita TaxID=84645 RepID=A0ABQ8L7U5_LABRO|nr:Prosaposin [Labeo rohita]